MTGILRYEPKSYPDKGEGLKLESLPDHQPSSFDMGGMYQGAIEIEESDSCESMDEDMIEDVVKLAEALQSKYLDVQADAATAVAGLTSDGESYSLKLIPSSFFTYDLDYRSLMKAAAAAAARDRWSRFAYQNLYKWSLLLMSDTGYMKPLRSGRMPWTTGTLSSGHARLVEAFNSHDMKY